MLLLCYFVAAKRRVSASSRTAREVSGLASSNRLRLEGCDCGDLVCVKDRKVESVVNVLSYLTLIW